MKFVITQLPQLPAMVRLLSVIASSIRRLGWSVITTDAVWPSQTHQR